MSGVATADREELDKLWEVDKEKVEVYTLPDLRDSVLRLVEATNALYYFRYVLRPLPISELAEQALDPPTMYLNLGTADGALRQLNSLSLFQDALARVNGSKDR